MIFKFISDTHNDHQQLQIGSGDVLVHCGDACTKGNFTEGEAFLWWFVKQPFKYKVLVPGNHDKKLATHPGLQSLMRHMGIIFLNNEYTEIEGITLYGNGYTTSTERDTGKYREIHSLAKRKEAWKDYDRPVDLLITHNAPLYILDTNLEGQHIGDDILLNKVKINKPRYHAFGHIHEHGGKRAKYGTTQFLNVACKNREYLTVRQCQEVKICASIN